ncbi:MAG: acyltransferase [Burkholderiales bacterium]|nr:acyltransferase [Burkholderiales bacterium]
MKTIYENCSPRNNGLDSLRALAIITVFLHNFYYANPSLNFGIITSIGWVGVDLFFTLSGYLIGNQLFKYLLIKKSIPIAIFLIRRILRTVPNYLIIVLGYIFFTSLRDNPTLPPLWQLLTFTTNLNLKSGTSLSYTWSLCVEEQFYLSLPFIVLILFRLKSSLAMLGGLLCIIGGGIYLREYLWNIYIGYNLASKALTSQQILSYKTHIYFFTLCRLDELIIGVIIAFIKNFHNNIWAVLTKYGNFMAYLGILSTGATLYIILNYPYFLYTIMFEYLLLGISFGLLIISCLSPNSILYSMKIPFVHSIALISYAIYLIEKPCNKIIMGFIRQYDITTNNWVSFIICTCSSLFVAYLLYMTIEVNFLKLRDKKILFEKP